MPENNRMEDFAAEISRKMQALGWDQTRLVEEMLRLEKVSMPYNTLNRIVNRRVKKPHAQNMRAIRNTLEKGAKIANHVSTEPEPIEISGVDQILNLFNRLSPTTKKMVLAAMASTLQDGKPQRE